jgi:hypothetical protein
MKAARMARIIMTTINSTIVNPRHGHVAGGAEVLKGTGLLPLGRRAPPGNL